MSADAIARHEEDLEEIVREGKRRKMDYDRAHGILVTDTPIASITASTQGSSLALISDFEPFEGGEVVPATPPLPSQPTLICGYTAKQWELRRLREEVKRLQAEDARLSGAADPEHNPHPNLISDADRDA